VNCDNISFHVQKFYELNVVVVVVVVVGGGGGGSRACHTAVYLHQTTTVMTPSTHHK
jgi:succinate dehydrogenase/fumarate reductase flavoprotein subunit